MSISVELIPCHDGEPDSSAIDRVCGRGTADYLDEDDPAAPVPIYQVSPAGWRDGFLTRLRRVADWAEHVGLDGTGLTNPAWRWHVYVGEQSVTLTYRRTGPSRDGDLDDGVVLELAAEMGMIAYWPDLLTWVDLRVEAAPETLG